MKKLFAVLGASLALGAVTTACTTMGTGTGSLGADDKPVSFAWKSTDGGTSGTMSATLADGKTFSGAYVQPTNTTRTDEFAPMWVGWNYGWPDWTWGGLPATAFTTQYSGRVMANLQSSDGGRRRVPGSMRALLGSALALAAGIALAQPPAPDALVREITDDVLASIREDKAIQAGDQRKIAALVQAKILPHFDFARASAIAVGPHWRRATPAQREALTAQFETLLVRTYSSALAAYRDQVITVLPVHMAPSDTEVTVRSQIKQSGAAPISIDYTMERAGAEWKVFDVFDEALELAGVAHLARGDGDAELGVSVLSGYRRRGIGGALLARAVLRARNWGVRALFMHCLRENGTVMHLARRQGMRIVTERGEADAWLALPPADASSQLAVVELFSGR